MQINKITQYDVRADNGVEVMPGDSIVLRIGTEDIICKYSGISGSYFVTRTLDGSTQNRYRPSSIKNLSHLNEFLNGANPPRIVSGDQENNGKEEH